MGTTTKTRCETVDQIVEWTDKDGTLQIEPGDMILHVREFEVIATISRTPDPRHVRYTLESSPRQNRYARVHDLVAVRRYIETSEE